MSEHKTLYQHIPHVHFARNVNRMAETEQQAGGFNQRIAVAITRGMGNMWCAYIFAALAICGFPGFHAGLSQYVQWLSQTFIQLTALSILAVGQDVLSHHQQLQAEEAYQTTLHSFHDLEQMKLHEDAQDAKMIEIHENIQALSTQVAQLITLLDKPKTTKKTEALK